MKKLTLTIVFMIEENEENLQAIEEMKEVVDSGILAAGVTEGLDDVEATASLLIEDVE